MWLINRKRIEKNELMMAKETAEWKKLVSIFWAHEFAFFLPQPYVCARRSVYVWDKKQYCISQATVRTEFRCTRNQIETTENEKSRNHNRQSVEVATFRRDIENHMNFPFSRFFFTQCVMSAVGFRVQVRIISRIYTIYIYVSSAQRTHLYPRNKSRAHRLPYA